MADVKSLKKELKRLQKQVDEQQAIISSLRGNDSLDSSVDYLSQVFLTRDEYPKFDEVNNRLAKFEKKLTESEMRLKDQVEVIESDAIEQRKLLEKMERRMKIGNVSFLGAVLSVFGFENKKGTIGRKNSKN